VVTCQAQPALGGVFKLVEINGDPRIKLSEDVIKITIPGRKEAYRIYVKDEVGPFLDLLIQVGEEPPQIGKKVLCRHPFDETKRVIVTPTRVEKLHILVWDGKRIYSDFTPTEVRDFAMSSLKSLRDDHLRLVNPTPYKVCVSEKLYNFIHELWQKEAPIMEY